LIDEHKPLLYKDLFLVLYSSNFYFFMFSQQKKSKWSLIIYSKIWYTIITEQTELKSFKWIGLVIQFSNDVIGIII